MPSGGKQRAFSWDLIPADWSIGVILSASEGPRHVAQGDGFRATANLLADGMPPWSVSEASCRGVHAATTDAAMSHSCRTDLQECGEKTSLLLPNADCCKEAEPSTCEDDVFCLSASAVHEAN